jgi:hypothetical protein
LSYHEIKQKFADAQCDFEGEVDGENVDEGRTFMNCDLDCQFEDGLDERIDVGDELDCCIGYDEVQIHLFIFNLKIINKYFVHY